MIELLVTLSIAAILLAVAVPNFIVFIQNNRLAGQANDLVTMLNYARSEAVKRNGSVTVCGSTTTNSCSGSSDWTGGLIVFADANGNAAVDGGDTILQVRQALENGNSLNTGGLSAVTYQSNGFSPAANDVFRLCDSRGTASARAITVSPQGRIATSTGTASCP